MSEEIEVPLWNETVADLTLMALGSSAPEILLSVIGTVKDIEAVPGELGPSTIVGSAAFNLLVITAVSIAAVNDSKEVQVVPEEGGEPKTETVYIAKKVFDMKVFSVTAISSLFAYIWLYTTLAYSSKEVVESWEAWATFIFFFILIGMAFGADKWTQYQTEKKESDAERKKRNHDLQVNA